ncbi:baculoviral IAP repeat-containing protein 5.1-like isoform X2 [Coturnix japonica]|uniref:baculoviral IAP repeat-containing protein 5.1-like isoform X2 n=1 Tax=Coturnix japonica TaxID=93934 RepID=UPI00077700D4|nr:baculoviral IAP repeat-containing protein 5.1-like isoform X2 [Coturnix japonica]
MEVLLKELLSSSKLLSDFKEMYDYEKRLQTFNNWPFVKNCKCTPENMAKAGFVHCPSANEPDVAKCFFCLIELEGWEPNDDPWEEHAKRRSCGFLSLPKSFDELTMEEYYMLEMTRLRTFLCKTGRSVISSFEEEVAATRKRLVDNFVSKHQYTPQLPAPIQADPACRPSESSYDRSEQVQK